ncbi:hypothetical protein F5Y11DRAFT_341905 [Daldinia sp. FL1419]|nr:hypothetical protein F5Y11DRAFT_341905 [Daldinia sp. FL1419]
MGQENDEGATSKEAKGKEVATNSNNVLSESVGQEGRSSSIGAVSDTTSFISRLSASASKLANDMVLQRLSGASLADTLPSDKAESSRPGQDTAVNEAPTCSSFAQGTVPDTFRSARTQEQEVPSESSFSSFLNGTGTLEETDPGDIKVGEYGLMYTPAYYNIQQTNPINPKDGMDVVDLLDLGYDEVEETGLVLTNTDQATLHRRLFEDGESREHTSLHGQWDNILNFFPGFGPNGNGIKEYGDLLGVSDLEEARNIWVDKWRDVLSSYTDEVWGELGSLVKVAQEELTNVSEPHEASSPPKLKAVRRLQQLLNHIRGTQGT